MQTSPALTTTAQPAIEDTQKPTEVENPDLEKRKVWTEIRQSADMCKSYKRKLIQGWRTNIDFRRGTPVASQVGDNTMPINLDWSYTKTKHAALFSQVPKARVNHSPESIEAGQWVSQFERRLNDNLVTAGIEAAMEECMPDCINAAGFAVVIVSRETLTVPKEVPSIELSLLPPQILQQVMQSGQIFGQPIPMETVPTPIDSRYTVRRVSPADFLWPIDFTGSNFDNALWTGHTGRLTWAEAARRFNLSEEDKKQLLSETGSVLDKLSHDYEKDPNANFGRVGFDEIFYKEHAFNRDAESFNAIHHLVFLHGKTTPVIDELWSGQEVDPESKKLIGAIKSPLRVLTISYISDDDIPPSDSAVGRQQVIELNRGMSNINKQRARNAPWTWFDANRLDPAIQTALMQGVWQHAIPVQGDGSRIIGTIQQPAMNQENFTFDRIYKMNLSELWTIGPNQMGVGGDIETKGESSVIEGNFNTKIGKERARVASFFVGIAEVLGGLMCLYEDPATFGEGFDASFGGSLGYSILVDSTVLVDSKQRLEQLNNYLDKYAKLGYVQIEPVLKEITTLIGLDPGAVVKAPEPPPPPQPNISLRLTGAQDMMNPLLLAFMIELGHSPKEESIEQAKKLIQSSVTMQPGQPIGPLPQGQPAAPGDANPQAALLPTIGQRAETTSAVPAAQGGM